MNETPRRTWPRPLPLLDRDFQSPIRSNHLIDAPMATRRRTAPRALMWWTVATVATVALAVTLLVEVL